MSLIKLKNVSKSYLNKTFDIEIKAFEQILIVGKNGSGKSTLVKLISKYIKPSTGIINSSVKKISYLEEKVSLPKNLVVKDYINLLKKIKLFDSDIELLQSFKIPLNKKINELSKGNLQKLAIISIFIGDSDLIILDEPLNGLDTKAIDLFLNYIKKYQKPIIIITHYPHLYEHLKFKIISL